jgi:hypothetical protein
MVPESLTIAELIKQVRSSHNRPDIDVIVCDGATIDPGEMFDDYYNPSTTFIFARASDWPDGFPTPPPRSVPKGRPAQQPAQPVAISPPPPIAIPPQQPIGALRQGTERFTLLTTANYQSLTLGEEIQIDGRTTLDQLQTLLVHRLGAGRTYFPFGAGGRPFVCDGICSLYGPADPLRLYVVSCPNAGVADWQGIVWDCCDIYSNELQQLLSPNEQSTELGLCQISLILEYFRRSDADVVQPFIDGVARLTLFPPAVLALTRVRRLSKLDLVTITATLHSLFTSFLMDGTPAFDYAFRCMSVVRMFANGRVTITNGLYRPIGVLEKFRDAHEFADVERLSTHVFDFEPIPVTMQLARLARNAIVAIHPYIGLTLCGSPCKPLSLTSTVEIVNPMNRRNPRSRLAIEILVHLSAIQPPGELPQAIAPVSVRQLIVLCIEAGSALAEGYQGCVTQVVNHLIRQFALSPCRGCLVFAPATPPGLLAFRMKPGFESQSLDAWPALSSSVATWETLQMAVVALSREKREYPAALLRIIVVIAPRCNRPASRISPYAVERALTDNQVFLDCLLFDGGEELGAIAPTTRGTVIPLHGPISGVLAALDADWFVDVSVR